MNNKTWSLPLAQVYEKDDVFQWLMTGKKTIETRAPTPDNHYLEIKVGDHLLFESSCGAKLVYEVTEFNHYKNLWDMYVSEDIDKIIPGIGPLSSLAAAYYSFPNYEEKIKEYGIIAMHIEFVEYTSALMIGVL